MKLQYRFNGPGPQVHTGHHGCYEFKQDAQGRLVAEVGYGADVDLFTSLLGHDGKPLFVPVDEAKPARKSGKKAQPVEPGPVPEPEAVVEPDPVPVMEAWPDDDDGSEPVPGVDMDEDGEA